MVFPKRHFDPPPGCSCYRPSCPRQGSPEGVRIDPLLGTRKKKELTYEKNQY